MSGMYFQLHKGVPKNQELESDGSFSKYEQNLIQKAPIRLWRRTPLKD